MTSTRPLRIGFVCTHSLTLATLYKGLFPYLIAQGCEVEAIVGDSEYTRFDAEHFGEFRRHVVPMGRMPHPVKDAIALVRMVRLLRARRYDVLHVSTPKAALVGSLAARIVGIPVVFVYRRCVYELMTGFKRWAFLQNDRIVCALADRVVPISRQIRDYLARERIAPQHKLVMIGSGSSNGIDVQRFHPDRVTEAGRLAQRRELKIAPDAPVLLFVGRVCSEKGVDLLPPMFEAVRARHPRAVLVVAGPDDARDPAAPETLAAFAADPGMRRIGFVSDPAPLFAMADLFVFPSWFEGFGNVLLEAAAQQRVAIGFDVHGVSEAIAHGTSGILVPAGDHAAMASAAADLLDDPAARAAMAHRARIRVEREFANAVIWGGLEALLREVARRPGQAAAAPPATLATPASA